MILVSSGFQVNQGENIVNSTEKPSYKKPIAQNLNGLSHVLGSCFTGGANEYDVTGQCLSGATAAPDPSEPGCSVGSIVLQMITCSPGGSAAFSCLSGSAAG